jgi:hypothetical protein
MNVHRRTKLLLIPLLHPVNAPNIFFPTTTCAMNGLVVYAGATRPMDFCDEKHEVTARSDNQDLSVHLDLRMIYSRLSVNGSRNF